ncbi:MAG: dioxygenase, partial [Myxococcota bacterium]
MSTVTIENITRIFEASLSPDMNPRAREVLIHLVRHLHAFAREVHLTHEDWLVGIDYLTRAARLTDDKRNEFILISDVLGLESLVDAISHDARGSETESAVLGPFYREGAPKYGRDETISQRGAQDGASVRIQGRVMDGDGRPVPEATLDVWETGPEGLYEQQDPEQPDMNLRGVFSVDSRGTYVLRAVKPVSYPIPYDGPTGDLLKVMGRHPYRPAHIHMIVRAPGYKALVSQIYDREDPYIESDSVYSVKGSLLIDFERAPEGSDVEFLVRHDVILK